MKVSNETKVGAIAVVAVTFLILGFNFLKGKKLFSESKMLYGIYGNVQGLANSNPIMINGLQVGTVYKIATDKDMRRITVTLNITKDINVPRNSIAIIKANPIGTTSVEIKLGDAINNLNDKDTIYTEANAGVFNDVLKKIDPVLYEVRKAVNAIDTLLINVNSVIDPRAKYNIGSTLENVNRLTASMLISTASLNQLLNAQTGTLAKSLNNMSLITGNLARQNEKIDHVVTNLDKATTKLAALDIQKTLNTLDATVNDMKALTAKLNDNKGSLGLLLNDPSFYRNLASTGNKLNLLLDDIRVNPKRYVSISVFGKKQKTSPLMYPQPDTLNSPYIIKNIKD